MISQQEAAAVAAVDPFRTTTGAAEAGDGLATRVENTIEAMASGPTIFETARALDTGSPLRKRPECARKRRMLEDQALLRVEE